MTFEDLTLSEEELSSNPYRKKNALMFDRLLTLVNSDKTSYHRRLTAKGSAKMLKSHPDFIPPFGDLYEWVLSVWPDKIKEPRYRLATACYWILHGLEDFPTCPYCGLNTGYVGKNIRSVFLGYFPYCSRKCMQNADGTKLKRQVTNVERIGVPFPGQNPESMEKAVAAKRRRYGNGLGDLDKLKATNIKLYGKAHPFTYGSEEFKALMVDRFGFENPVYNTEIRKKTKSKYSFDGRQFDSKDELAYYIWLRDTNADFLYNETAGIEYEYACKKHLYFPDFVVKDAAGIYCIEIKGDQFFNPDGTMKCPFRKKEWTDEQYANRCALEEAKRQCMLKCGVRIVRTLSDEMKGVIAYVRKKYGRNYLKSFKNNGKKSKGTKGRGRPQSK